MALSHALDAAIDLVKPNLRELGQFAGHPIEHDAQIRQAARSLISERKAQVVVTSLGSSGAVLTTSSDPQHIRAPTVRIRGKVGAGDSMVAGVVLALCQNASIERAVRYGVAAGSAAVMTEGTELCRREDTERLYQEMLAD